MIPVLIVSHLICQVPVPINSFPELPTDDSPASIETRLNYLADLERGHNWERLESICMHWLESNPSDPSAWFGIGNANLGRKNFTKAIDAYRKAVTIKPDMWRAWWNLGIVYQSSHDQKGMAECFQALQKIEPQMGRKFRRMVIGLQ